MKYLSLCLLSISLNSFASNQAECLRFQANEFIKAKNLEPSMRQENIRIHVKNVGPAKIEANLLKIKISAAIQGENCEVISADEIVSEAARKQNSYDDILIEEVAGKFSVAQKMLPQNCEGMLEDIQIEKQVNKCQNKQCKMIYLALSLGERERLDPRDEMALRRQELNPFNDHAFFTPKYPVTKLGKLCKTWAFVQKK
jgi:hypothetical protein